MKRQQTLGVALMLCGLGVLYSGEPLASDWKIEPLVDVVESYSNNITLASDAAVASADYVTQIAPGVNIKGKGNRLNLDSSYTMQNIFYADNSSQNQTYNQLQLGADAELLEDLFYLSVDGQLSQQALSSGKGLAADNLNIGSGRSDVATSRIEPSLKHRLGNYAEFDLSYAEGRVNYESDTIVDGLLQDKKFSMGRSRESARLDWQLSYSQSRQWAAERLASEREQSAATLRYALFDHVSVVANGGRENGQITSGVNSYKNGNYWSTGLMWRPSPQLSLEAAKGDKDRQASLRWAPGARTSLSASYLDREVGVRASNSRTGTFSHSGRRTLWVLSHVKEISSDAILAIVGSVPVVMLDKSGEPLFDDLGRVMIGQNYQLGIVNELFRRESSQLGFTYSARKNSLSLGANHEQRHYEVTNRQARLSGGFLGWHLQLSGRASSDVKYSVNRTMESNIANETETKSLSWSLKRTLGKQITTGVELRTTEVDGGVATLSHSENRISANARVVF